MVRILSALLAATSLLGCGSELQFNLIIYDPCNQTAISTAEHIELEIASPDLSDPVSIIWSAAEGQGELQDVPVVDQAVVSVVGRASNGSGGPGLAVAAGTVGRLNLTGEDNDENLLELSLAIGKVGMFMNTTNTANPVECTSLAAERRNHTATLLNDGRVFIAGGVSVNTAAQPPTTTYWETTELYDPATGTFKRGPNLTWKRQGHTATLMPDGRVLLAGGIGLIGTGPGGTASEQALLIAQLYNPVTNQFEENVQFTQQRAHHTATRLADGGVLLVGGQFGGSELASTEIYKSGIFSSPGPTLNTPRAFHNAVLVGPQAVAIIGGRGSGSVLDSFEIVRTTPQEVIYDPMRFRLATARSHASAAIIPGKEAIVVAGGFGSLVTAPEVGMGLDSVEVIRLATPLMSSSVTCSTLRLNRPRGAAGTAALPRGILVAGGVDASSSILASAELLDFGDLDTCTAAIDLTAGPMNTARGAPQLTPLLGDDLLVTGGFGLSGGDVVSVGAGEIFVRPR